MGIATVVSLAAWVAAGLLVTMISTLRRTSSAASAVTRYRGVRQLPEWKKVDEAFWEKFQQISVGTFTKALGWEALWPSIATLATIAIVYFTLSVILLKKQED